MTEYFRLIEYTIFKDETEMTEKMTRYETVDDALIDYHEDIAEAMKTENIAKRMCLVIVPSGETVERYFYES